MDISPDRLSDRNDRRVMSFAEWCELNNFSLDTGKRLLRGGQGPRVMQLSPRRIGITELANREWQRSRERTDQAGKAA